MTTKITRIGNSRGVRIPKALLDLYGLDEDSRVDLAETRDGILIRRSSGEHAKKLSYEEAYAEMAQVAAERTEWIEWDAVAGDGADGSPSDRTDDQ